MIVYRLAKARFSRELSGKGAEKSGGRWNSRGVSMIYTSDSRALCTTEVAVHVPLGILPSDFKIISIEIPDHIKILVLPLSKLPTDWKSIPHSGSTQEIGDDFIKKNKAAVIKVPSAVVPGDFNFLFNPNHRDFLQINIKKIEDFAFNSRLFAV